MHSCLVTKISAFVVVLVALTVLLAAALMENISSRDLDRNALNSRTAALNDPIRQWDVALTQMSQDAALLASSQPIRNLAHNSLPEDNSGLFDATVPLEDSFRNYMANRPDYVQLRFIRFEGAEKAYEEVRIDRKGGVALSVPGSPVTGKDEWRFLRSVLHAKPGETIFSEINLGRVHGLVSVPYILVIRAAVPIYADDKAITGVLIIHRTVNDLFAALAAGLQANDHMYVTNSRGEYLLHPDRMKAFEFEYGSPSYIQETFPPLQDALNSQNLTSKFQEAEWDERYVQWRKLTLGESPRAPYLLVAVTTPKALINQSVNDLRLSILAVIIGSVAFAALSTVIFARRITRPIREISAAARRVGDGDYAAPLPMEREDEIGVLARSVQSMSDKVRHSIEELKSGN